MGDEGRSTAEGDDGRGGRGSSPKGAVRGGGGGFTFGGVGVPPPVGHGQEARGEGGAKWCSWHASKGGREEGKEKGGWHRRCLLSARWAAGGKGVGPRVESTWKIERRGALARRSAASIGPWPTGAGGRRTRAV
jgi:hypothetical protein